MEIVRMKSMEGKTMPAGFVAKFLVERKDVQVIDLVLSPGQVVPKHITPVDVFFYVVEGKGVIEIGEEAEQVSATDITVSPAQIPHGLRAAPDSAFSVLVVKTPNPAFK